MMNRFSLCLSLTVVALYGCASDDSTPDAVDENGKVTFIVDDMSERLNIL